MTDLREDQINTEETKKKKKENNNKKIRQKRDVYRCLLGFYARIA